jgi:hypothetical protein
MHQHDLFSDFLTATNDYVALENVFFNTNIIIRILIYDSGNFGVSWWLTDSPDE